MGPFLKYTVLRLGLFVAALALFALLGARNLLLVVLAAFASLIASFVLLKGPRDELSTVLAERADPSRRRRDGRFGRGLSQDAAAEDAAAEDAAADDAAVGGDDDARPGAR